MQHTYGEGERTSVTAKPLVPPSPGALRYHGTMKTEPEIFAACCVGCKAITIAGLKIHLDQHRFCHVGVEWDVVTGKADAIMSE